MNDSDKLAQIRAILDAPADPAPAAPATIQTQWGPKAYKDYPTYADFPQLVVLVGRALTDTEVHAWMQATGNGDPMTHDLSGNPIDAPTIDRSGFDLTPGVMKVNPVQKDEAKPYTVTGAGEGFVIDVSGAPGSFFHWITYSFNGGPSEKVQVAQGGGTFPAPAGNSTLQLSVDGAGNLATELRKA